MRLNAGGRVARVMLQELPGTFSVVARSDSERPGGREASLGEARRCSGELQGQEWGRRQKRRGTAGATSAVRRLRPGGARGRPPGGGACGEGRVCLPGPGGVGEGGA